MSRAAAFDRYRPVKVKDGQGGFTEQLVDPVTIWGTLKVHDEGTTMAVDAYEDVLINDIIEVGNVGS